jgi:ribosomal protein L7/L12
MEFVKHKNGTYSIKGLNFSEVTEMILTLNRSGNMSSRQIGYDLGKMIHLLSEGSLTLKEKSVLLSGQIIMCIKMVRERTGYGLKEAKMIVDSNKMFLSSIFSDLYGNGSWKITENMIDHLNLSFLSLLGKYLDIHNSDISSSDPLSLIDKRNYLKSSIHMRLASLS